MEATITHAQLICGDFYGIIDGFLLELERVYEIEDDEDHTQGLVYDNL